MLTRDREFYRSFFRLMLVVAVQNILAYSVNMADNLMLGSYSQVTLSGAATVNQIQFMVQQVGIALTTGMIMINSQYWGKRQMEPVRRNTWVALSIGIAVGACLLAITSVIPRALLSIFTKDAAILAEGMAYLSIIRFTYLLYISSAILLGALRSVETVRIAFWVSLMSLVVNVCINYTLIFGRFGFPELGIRGAAIGTVTARAAELCAVIGYMLREKKLRLFSGRLFDFSTDDVKTYLKVTAPAIAANLVWSMSTPIQGAILGHLSDDAIAANSISTTFYSYLKVIVASEASAAGVIVGKTIGEDREGKLREYVRTIQVIFVAVGATLALTLFAAREPLLRQYELTPAALDISRQIMLLMCVTFFGMSYQMPCSSGIIAGGGEPRFSLRMNLLFGVCIALPLGFLAAFVFRWPPVAVVACITSDQITKVLPIGLHVNSYKWVRHLTN